MSKILSFIHRARRRQTQRGFWTETPDGHVNGDPQTDEQTLAEMVQEVASLRVVFCGGAVVTAPDGSQGGSGDAHEESGGRAERGREEPCRVKFVED